jgi:hypothetical protein
MVPSTVVDIKSLAVNGGTVLTARVDNFEVGGTPIAMEVMGAFDVDGSGRITRWRELPRPTDAHRAGCRRNRIIGIVSHVWALADSLGSPPSSQKSKGNGHVMVPLPPHAFER